MTIHGRAGSLANRRFHHVCPQIEDVDELSSLQAIEIAQNVLLRPPSLRPADAHSTAYEIRAATVLNHRAQPVVAGGTAAHLQPHDPEIEVAKMNDVKRTHKIIGADRIAVMAALNIANEYLRCQDGVVSNNPAANIKIKGMTSKLEVALNRYK